MPEKTRTIRPRSRAGPLALIDGRTREAAVLRKTRAELLAHLGGHASPVERQLIERCAMLSLHVALFDRKALDNGGLSERDTREYLAFSNSLSRALRQLGLKSIEARGPSLHEYLAAKEAAAQPVSSDEAAA